MELLKLIIDPKKIYNTCFLCYKSSDMFTNLHDKNEIRDEQSRYTLSLWNIMKELFPTYEFVLSQACKECSTLILKLFVLMQRSRQNNELLAYFIDNITKSLDRDCARKKFKIKINVSTFDMLCNENVKETICNCKKCDMIFKSELLLRQHNKICHENSNEAIICYICGKMFVKSSSLRVHLTSHEEKQCPYCSKVLKSHYFNVHIKNHKQQIVKKKIKKYYYCNECHFKTLNKTSLQAHINKVHLNIRPYNCKICKKGFYKKSNLVEHVIIHAKLKEKVCEVCGESFVNDKTLKEHLRLHTGYKPFKCNLCSSSFINSGRRFEHMARKHREKKYSCEVCGKKFGLNKDLNKHLKTVHITHSSHELS